MNVLFLHSVTPRDSARVVRLDHKYVYLLSHVEGQLDGFVCESLKWSLAVLSM